MKILLLPIFLTSLVFGQCLFKVNVDTNVDENLIRVKATLKDNAKSVSADFSSLPLSNKDELIKKIKNGANVLDFDYVLQDKESINENFIMLLGSWLPITEELCTYELKVTLPKDMIPVSEANEVKQVNNSYIFKMNTPVDNVSLIASNKYEVKTTKVDDIEIATYFFKRHSSLSDSFMKKTKDLLKEYQELLGPYPYKRFAIVENSFQTGYSMPTFTLIGDRIISKPYLINRSLGHELVHQWIGNGLFLDEKGGNWTEGLTTWLSDYRGSEDKLRYRHDALQTYMLEADAKKSLKDFSFRYDRATKTLGYDKGFFLWQMISQKIGKEKFENLLRQFIFSKMYKKVSYDDIATFFISNTKELTKNWFDQWIKRAGMASYSVEIGKMSIEDGVYKLPLTIKQDTKEPYILDIPLHVKSDEGEFVRHLHVNEKNTSINLMFDERVYSLSVDPKRQNFRKLYAKEASATLGALLSSDDLIVVGKEVPTILNNAKLVDIKDFTMNMLENSDIVFTKESASQAAKFVGLKPLKGYSWSLHVKKNPWAKGKVVAFIEGAAPKSLSYRLKYYRTYSKLGLYKGRMLLKERTPLKNLTYKFDDMQGVLEPQKEKNFKNLYEKIKDEKIVMIGETHTNMAHHQNQLRIIKQMYKQSKDLAIALEMFQRPFQKYLDAYISGKIDLFELLEKSEYYERWKYDMYNYVDIFEYARKNGIKLLAINQDKKITRQVTKDGIASVSQDEQAQLPKFLDFSNEEYRTKLNDFFSSAHGERKFDTTRLYQSQIIWDETMAESIANYALQNPQKRIAVVVGSGHIRYFHGIPDRVERRVGFKPFVIVQDMNVVPNIADIVLMTSNIEGKESPKVGVYLDYDKMKVTKVIEERRGAKLGIKEGDIIVGFNAHKIKKIGDLKLALFKASYLDESFELKVKRGNDILILK